MLRFFHLWLMLFLSSSSLLTMSQPAIYLKAGAGVAGDAGMEYFGPNAYGGIAVKTSRNVTLDLDFQYFTAKLQSEGASPYYGEWRQKSLSFGPTFYWGQHIHKGFYTGAGITFQKRTHFFKSSWTNINDTLNYPTLNLKFGFAAFPAKRRSSFFAELNVTGPYAENTLYGSSYLEILTQLSILIGYRIGWRKEDPADDKMHHRLQLTKPY